MLATEIRIVVGYQSFLLWLVGVLNHSLHLLSEASNAKQGVVVYKLSPSVGEVDEEGRTKSLRHAKATS